MNRRATPLTDRSASAARPARAAAALVGVAGVLVLAGCSTTASTAAQEPAASGSASANASTNASTNATGDGASTYKDGTYTATGSYRTPESVEQISVTVTLASDVVTNVSISGTPQKRESSEYQAKFASGIGGVVVGKKIDELNVSKVSGSSLTSGGFNKALESIKSEAKG